MLAACECWSANEDNRIMVVKKFTQRVAVVIVVTVVALCTVASCIKKPVVNSKSRPGKQYLSDARGAKWTADGKALYFIENDGLKHWRYNVASDEKQSIKEGIGLGISRDGRYVLSQDFFRTRKNAVGPIDSLFLMVTNQATGKKTKIYKTPGYFECVTWLTNDLIAFSDIDTGEFKAVVINKNGKIVLSMPRAGLEIAGNNSENLVYSKQDGLGTYYYELATKRSRRLPGDVDLAENYLYLSAKQLVYNHYGVKTVDLKTMIIHDLKWSLSGSAMRLSALLNKYWVAYWPRGEYAKSELYLGDTPAYALKMMRQIESQK